MECQVSKIAKNNPEKIFLKSASQSLSYKEADRKINELANALNDLGISKGDICCNII